MEHAVKTKGSRDDDADEFKPLSGGSFLDLYKEEATDYREVLQGFEVPEQRFGRLLRFVKARCVDHMSYPFVSGMIFHCSSTSASGLPILVAVCCTYLDAYVLPERC